MLKIDWVLTDYHKVMHFCVMAADFLSLLFHEGMTEWG